MARGVVGQKDLLNGALSGLMLGTQQTTQGVQAAEQVKQNRKRLDQADDELALREKAQKQQQDQFDQNQQFQQQRLDTMVGEAQKDRDQQRANMEAQMDFQAEQQADRLAQSERSSRRAAGVQYARMRMDERLSREQLELQRQNSYGLRTRQLQETSQIMSQYPGAMQGDVEQSKAATLELARRSIGRERWEALDEQSKVLALSNAQRRIANFDLDRAEFVRMGTEDYAMRALERRGIAPSPVQQQAAPLFNFNSPVNEMGIPQLEDGALSRAAIVGWETVMGDMLEARAQAARMYTSGASEAAIGAYLDGLRGELSVHMNNISRTANPNQVRQMQDIIDNAIRKMYRGDGSAVIVQDPTANPDVVQTPGTTSTAPPNEP